ncbi:hypothetical protein BH20ACI1_BH20ACI1_03660 [soil metagenome]
MKNIFYIFSAIVIFSAVAFAQKGIDTQTEKIKQEGSSTTPQSNTRTNNPTNKAWDWGKGKTKVRQPLPNPYRLNSRRDVLVENITDVLKEKKIVIDEAASRIKDGIIITEPFVFAKGAIVTNTELNRYADLPNLDTAWTRGRFTLTIEVQSIDGIQNNVSVTAKVEGRSENGLRSEWTTLQSSGSAEDEFLVKLVEMITGISPDAQQVDN